MTNSVTSLHDAKCIGMRSYKYKSAVKHPGSRLLPNIRTEATTYYIKNEFASTSNKSDLVEVHVRIVRSIVVPCDGSNF